MAIVDCILLSGFIFGWIITVVYMSVVAIRTIHRLLFPKQDDDRDL